METKWTPGPWRKGHLGSVWRVYDGEFNGKKGRINQPICDATMPAGLSDDEKFANAHLIAAAPELYEALDKCVHNWSALGGPAEDWLHEARAALRKARGEA